MLTFVFPCFLILFSNSLFCAGILEQSLEGKDPSRIRVIVPGHQATQAGEIDSLESIPGLLKSLKITSLLQILFQSSYFSSLLLYFSNLSILSRPSSFFTLFPFDFSSFLVFLPFVSFLLFLSPLDHSRTSTRRWNLRKYIFVEVSGHNLEIYVVLEVLPSLLHSYLMIFMSKLEFFSIVCLFCMISETIGVVWFSVRFSSI